MAGGTIKARASARTDTINEGKPTAAGTIRATQSPR